MPPAHAPRCSLTRARDESGFTLIEVLVTVLVLVVGLLGAFATLRASAHTTLTNRERQAETSLAREVIEDASLLSYTQLTSAALPGALQAQAMVAHATIAPGGLQVTRGPANYLVTLNVDSLDDPSADISSGDEKRLSVIVSSAAGASPPGVKLSTLIFNPTVS